MVVLAAAFGFCYGCAAVAESTRLLQFEKEVTVKRIAFFFGTGVGGDKCDGWSVLRWEGVTVSGGDCHGEGVLGANSYGGSHRRVYRRRSTAGIISTFQTIRRHYKEKWIASVKAAKDRKQHHDFGAYLQEQQFMRTWLGLDTLQGSS